MRGTVARFRHSGEMQDRSAIGEALGYVLAPAIDAVRTTLRRRAPDEVPHRLRPVVRSSSKRLPPPLAATLLGHLEDDEELRRDASELLDGPPAARAYLVRDTGWWEVVATAVEDHMATRGAADRDAVHRALAEARSEIEETRRRLAGVREELERSISELAGVKEAHSNRLGAARARDVARIEELEAEVVALRGEFDRSEDARRELQRDLELLRRRARGRPQVDRPADDGGGGFGGDPRRMARRLDLELGMLQRRRAARSRLDNQVPPQADPVRLDPPAGLRATDKAWFSWLAAVETPFWLIVDGHNVVFTLSNDKSQMADAMRRLESGLRRLSRAARTRARITLVYDSGLAGEREAVRSERGFVVEFAPVGVTADDEIVALAHSADVYDEAVVVVTSDRELQHRVDGAAIVVGADALAAHVVAG